MDQLPWSNTLNGKLFKFWLYWFWILESSFFKFLTFDAVWLHYWKSRRDAIILIDELNIWIVGESLFSLTKLFLGNIDFNIFYRLHLRSFLLVIITSLSLVQNSCIFWVPQQHRLMSLRQHFRDASSSIFLFLLWFFILRIVKLDSVSRRHLEMMSSKFVLFTWCHWKAFNATFLWFMLKPMVNYIYGPWWSGTDWRVVIKSISIIL